jgi:hypothetical protein
LGYAANWLDSGRGAQAWIEIAYDTHPLPTKRIENATAHFLKELQRACGACDGYRIDSVCYDLGRIARLPGTRNTRTGRYARFVDRPLGRVVGTDFVHRFYREHERYEETRPVNTSNLIALSPHLNGLVREFLHNGVEEGDRHHAAHASALSLLNLGMGHDSIRYWVLRGGNRCRPRLSKGDILHCIHTALNKEAHEDSNLSHTDQEIS